MKAREIGRMPTYLNNSIFADSTIFNRPIDKLNSLDIQGFLAVQRHKGYRDEAAQLVALLATEAASAVESGIVKSAPFLDLEYQIEKVTFTADELARRLAQQQSLARRLALLFSLETGMPIKELIVLTWKEASEMELSPLAALIVQARPRHLRINYVFWEYLTTGVAAPLFGLDDDAVSFARGIKWPAMQRIYTDMLWVDRKAEAREFKKLVGLE